MKKTIILVLVSLFSVSLLADVDTSSLRHHHATVDGEGHQHSDEDNKKTH